MNMKTKFGAIITAVLLSLTPLSADKNHNGDKDIITEKEIHNVDSIDDGIMKILQTVNAYGVAEYQAQVEEGVEKPYFWLLKPLDMSADNPVDMFAPDFTKGIKMGACYEKHFHIRMQNGESIEDSQLLAKQDVPGCMRDGADELGEFASKVRQMVLCHPKHGQLLLATNETLHFAAAMPCHISIYEKDGKVFVSWRNSHEMAKKDKLNKEEKHITEEIQEAMLEMLGDL